jgi:hypothetical protein
LTIQIENAGLALSDSAEPDGQDRPVALRLGQSIGVLDNRGRALTFHINWLSHLAMGG